MKDCAVPSELAFTTESGSLYRLTDISFSNTSELVHGTLDMPLRKLAGRVCASAVITSAADLPQVGQRFIATITENGATTPRTLVTTPVKTMEPAPPHE